MVKMKNFIPVECVQFNASLACSITPARWCDLNQSRQLTSTLLSMGKGRQVIGVCNVAWSEIRFSSHSFACSFRVYAEELQEKTRPKNILARKLCECYPDSIGLLPDASIINFSAMTFHFVRFLPYTSVMDVMKFNILQQSRIFFASNLERTRLRPKIQKVYLVNY